MTMAHSVDLLSEAAKPSDDSTIPAQNQDETLLQQIAELTAALAAQTVTIEQLQTELEQTRNESRQLADTNAQLTHELKTLQTQQPGTALGTLTTKTASPSYQELRISSPPIAATGNPPNSFNKDVGWFD